MSSRSRCLYSCPRAARNAAPVAGQVGCTHSAPSHGVARRGQPAQLSVSVGRPAWVAAGRRGSPRGAREKHMADALPCRTTGTQAQEEVGTLTRAFTRLRPRRAHHKHRGAAPAPFAARLRPRLRCRRLPLDRPHRARRRYAGLAACASLQGRPSAGEPQNQRPAPSPSGSGQGRHSAVATCSCSCSCSLLLLRQMRCARARVRVCWRQAHC